MCLSHECSECSWDKWTSGQVDKRTNGGGDGGTYLLLPSRNCSNRRLRLRHPSTLSRCHLVLSPDCPGLLVHRPQRHSQQTSAVRGSDPCSAPCDHREWHPKLARVARRGGGSLDFCELDITGHATRTNIRAQIES